MAYAPDSVTNPDNKGGGLPHSIQTSSTTSTDPNKTLDFHQAMGDFKSMFPSMDEEIIEAVLRANNGAVDATIDQLLSMSMGNEEMGIGLCEPHKVLHRPGGNLGYSKRSDSVDDDDLPPSYEQATKGMEDDSVKPAVPARKKNVMSDLLLLSPTETSPQRSRRHNNNNDLEMFMPSPSPPTTQAPPPPLPPAPPKQSKRNDQIDLLSSDLATFNFSLAGSNDQTIPKRPVTPPVPPHPPKSVSPRSKSSKPHSSAKPLPTNRKPYRKWNPPLLGKLPDDFLRLDYPKKRMSSFIMEDSSLEHATHHPVMLSRRSSTPISSTLTQRTSPNQNRNKPKRTQSFATSSGHGGATSELSRSRTERHSSGGSNILNQARAELSSTVLRQKMADNELRRSSLAAEIDPELAQQLDDEKLALALQNEEFLEILQQNEDFMKTLERDRMNATAFEPMATSDSDEDQHEGYGEDKTQDPVHAFPFTKTVDNDNDQNAEFKKQLSQMGQCTSKDLRQPGPHSFKSTAEIMLQSSESEAEYLASKNKFQALARKFFSRKRRKSPKQVLKESSAPSTLNLLEDNDDEEFEHNDRTEVDLDQPTFEPLPGSQLSNVPSYKTVQRPPYHPDTIITHQSDDMV